MYLRFINRELLIHNTNEELLIHENNLQIQLMIVGEEKGSLDPIH